MVIGDTVSLETKMSFESYEGFEGFEGFERLSVI